MSELVSGFFSAHAAALLLSATKIGSWIPAASPDLLRSQLAQASCPRHCCCRCVPATLVLRRAASASARAQIRTEKHATASLTGLMGAVADRGRALRPGRRAPSPGPSSAMDRRLAPPLLSEPRLLPPGTIRKGQSRLLLQNSAQARAMTTAVVSRPSPALPEEGESPLGRQDRNAIPWRC